MILFTLLTAKYVHIVDDNKLVEKLLFPKGRPEKTSFYHFEERFMKFGETVVIIGVFRILYSMPSMVEIPLLTWKQ